MGKKIFMGVGGGSEPMTEEELKKIRAEQAIEQEAKHKVLRGDSIEKNTKEAVTDYNKSLFKFDPSIENLTLPEGKVLLRLFKVPKVTASGIYIPETITTISENTGKPKLVTTDTGEDRYYSRGVIVHVGANTTVQPGDVVDLYMLSYKNILQYWSPLDRMNIDEKSTSENYFTIPENQINFIWKNYQL